MRWLNSRKIIVAVIALTGGVALLQYAYAQSSTSISLNTPVAFPVDI